MLALAGLAVACLIVAMSYTSDCAPLAATTADANRVTAVRSRCYGAPEALEIARVEKPVPQANEVLVRIEAASVNPLDWHYMRGSPYVMRFMSGLGAPKDSRLGADFAGVVEAVGKDVTTFAVGDGVFGTGKGAFGQYTTKHVDGSLAKIPPNVSFEQAAALPIAGITALQALRDHGQLQAGQRVLVNGASGGVGTFAVQLAKSLGATVTGVCSERNREMVLAIGADRVIDYRTSNYTESEEKYDLIIDMVGNHPMSANLDVLEPTGRLVIVGGKKGNWIGPLTNMLKEPFISPFVEQPVIVMLARPNGADLEELARLVETGDIEPVIDRRYSLQDVPAAIAYSEEGRARGKIIIDVR